MTLSSLLQSQRHPLLEQISGYTKISKPLIPIDVFPAATACKAYSI
jgi:hypothetical protein